ncbi:MAG: VOC family protein [Pseudomonadota bacterium]
MNSPFTTFGAFSWCELLTDQPEKAKEFYGQLFGWTLEEMKMQGGPEYLVIKVGDTAIGGMMKKPSMAKDAPNYWGTYVTVKSADETAAKAKKLGATILVPPTDIPGVGRFCVLQDAQGATLSAINYIPMEKPLQ